MQHHRAIALDEWFPARRRCPAKPAAALSAPASASASSYDHYVAQGGDWRCVVTEMARQQPALFTRELRDRFRPLRQN